MAPTDPYVAGTLIIAFIAFVLFIVGMSYIHDRNQVKIDEVNYNVLVKYKKEQNMRCVYCHDSYPEFSCFCNAQYHLECWNELKQCTSIGCSGKELMHERIKKAAYLLSQGLDKDPTRNWLKAEKQILGISEST